MTGTVYTCLHTNQSRSYLNHPVQLHYSRYSSRCSEGTKFETNLTPVSCKLSYKSKIEIWIDIPHNAYKHSQYSKATFSEPQKRRIFYKCN